MCVCVCVCPFVRPHQSICPSRPGCLSGAFSPPTYSYPLPPWRQAVQSSLELILLTFTVVDLCQIILLGNGHKGVNRLPTVISHSLNRNQMWVILVYWMREIDGGLDNPQPAGKQQYTETMVA